MVTLITIGLIVCMLLVIVGGIGFGVCWRSQALHDAEIEGMKQGGRFKGEPAYMQQFRITRAEFDLESNLRCTRYAYIAFWVGIVGILLLMFWRF